MITLPFIVQCYRMMKFTFALFYGTVCAEILYDFIKCYSPFEAFWNQEFSCIQIYCQCLLKQETKEINNSSLSAVRGNLINSNPSSNLCTITFELFWCTGVFFEILLGVSKSAPSEWIKE